uniref:Uncharacterized protein n=1 Tax=Arundo donax TaxID=35708 RepID=A0A0A9B615_ARUDO
MIYPKHNMSTLCHESQCIRSVRPNMANQISYQVSN